MNDGVWVSFAGGRGSGLQQLDILFRTDAVRTPFGVDVRLIPDLVVADASAVAFGDGGHEVGEVLEIVRRRVFAHVVASGAAPRRRVADAHDQFHVVLLGQVDDVVVLFPRGPIRFVAAILEIAASVDLDILPGKLLPQPMVARVAAICTASSRLAGSASCSRKTLTPKGSTSACCMATSGAKRKPWPELIRQRSVSPLTWAENSSSPVCCQSHVARRRRPQREKRQPAQDEQAGPEQRKVFQGAGHARRQYAGLRVKVDDGLLAFAVAGFGVGLHIGNLRDAIAAIVDDPEEPVAPARAIGFEGCANSSQYPTLRSPGGDPTSLWRQWGRPAHS